MTNRELREKAEADGEPEWRYRPVNDRLPPEDAGKTLPPYFAETVEEKNRRVNKIMSEMVLPAAFVILLRCAYKTEQYVIRAGDTLHP